MNLGSKDAFNKFYKTSVYHIAIILKPTKKKKDEKLPKQSEIKIIFLNKPEMVPM